MVLAPQPKLHLAGTYGRRVGASLRRVWENVYDWEHLAHLHDGSFIACDLLDRGAWGWRARLVLANRDEQLTELRADRDDGSYVSTTLEGKGAGTQIRVKLAPVAPHVTDMSVEFHVPETRPDRLDEIGRAYAAIYARLWDEDEAMMRERERMLSASTAASDMPARLDLGREVESRARLPVFFEWGARSFRLVALEGRLVAHATVFPHWLGPLGNAPVVAGAVRCPWHGYLFDIVTGTCVGRPGLTLDRAPHITVEGGRVTAAVESLA
ncbi:Rieske (2Fe-2S) protein [uncultured Sphingomonas sp.]|uniref:Rieske (2Fe-2S) protein n=1 Tax=uncultured Sphingomonas sp. TaxID=158754 RepID=UPI0035CB8BBC